MTTISKQERYRATQRITLIGAIVNVVLSVAKITVGWLAHSQALIADGLHSLSDLISDGVVLLAAHHSKEHADEQHPYGHARFETAATAVVGALLVIVAFEFILEAGGKLLNPAELAEPGLMALIVTVLSIVAKEVLYQYTMIVAQRLNSSMLKANAWHHRTDSISSVIVLVGVGGAMLSVVWLDTVAAIVVGVMVGHIGVELVKQSFVELVDTGLASDKLEEIRNVIHSVPDVKELHELRTRRMGEAALVDVHILVDERISVSEGHQISEAVRARLIKQIDEVANVMVHIDPEDDAAGPLNVKLPLRDTVVAALQQCWEPLGMHERLEHINLHYLRGSIGVDVYIPLDSMRDVADAQHVARELARLSQHLTYIKAIKVFFCAAQN